MRTLLRTSLAFGLTLLLAQATLSQGYYFAEDELSSLESTPGVSIVYSKAIGPVAGSRQSEVESESKTGEEATTTTIAPTTAETTIIAEQATTTQTPTTITADATTADASSTTTKVAESSATTTTTIAPSSVEANVALPFGVRASASASTNDGSSGVNRLWHYNSQGLNTNTVWFSPSSRSVPAASSLDTEAVESSQSAVRVPATSAATSPAAIAPATSGASSTASTSATVSSSSAPVFFRRQPIVSDANDDDLDSSNTLTKRIGTNNQPPTERVSFGEYRARDSERNLYYPDIARIQANGVTVDASRSSSASASAAAAASASSSSSTSSSSFGVKGGSGFASGQNIWRQTERLTSPSKSVRKVVKSGAQVLSEEKTTFQREPVRVRVVVQKPSAHQAYGGFKVDVQNNYLERLQAASKTNSAQQQQQAASASAAASAAASASSSQSFFTTAEKSTKTASKFNAYAAKVSDSSEKEYVSVSSKIVQAQGVKSPPRPAPAPVKSLPPPPATKTAVKSPVRKPVFEQQTYERYEQEQPEPEPYSFNWQYGDETGNGQFRREEQDANGVVRGSYGYTDAWGLYRIVDYVADAGGYRASIRSNEPGLVERSPTTGQVPEPAHIKVSAGETPSAVVELMRLTKPKPAYQ